MSNGTSIVSESSLPESEMDTLMTHPSTAISEHSSVMGTPQHIREWLMSSVQDSPASRSALLANNGAKTTNEICGPKPSSALASYDHDTCSWRMCQGWLLADISAPSWETWPKAGSIVDGVFYPHPSAEPRTNEIDSGLLPTVRLEDAVAMAQMFPTPQATDGDKWSNQTVEERKAKGQSVRLPHALGVGGKLNPMWVEWLMNWPIGWTALDRLEMDKFLSWLQQHGDC